MIPIGKPFLTGLEAELVGMTISEGRLTQGPMVQEFERRMAAALGVKDAVAVSSGTTAIHLALAALGLGPGDEVLVPDLTFVATANAVAYTGARPVLVDVEPGSWGMDPAKAAQAVTDRTRAILPVHLYGAPAAMGDLAKLADDRGLFLVEDAAEGFGGEFEGQNLGAFGHFGCFSFYANKIITTGEGGMLVTDLPQLAGRARFLRGQAMDPGRRFFHTDLGFNYRMTDVAAAIGVAQLESFEELFTRRSRVIRRYDEALGLPSPSTREGAAPWLYTCLLSSAEEREGLALALEESGVETRPAFAPLHEMPMYAADPAAFPIASELAARGLSLPTYPDLSEEDQELVINRVKSFLDGGVQ